MGICATVLRAHRCIFLSPEQNTPVSLGFSGGQDVDVYLLETLISLRDGGDRIADLNIFNTIGNVKLQKMSDCQDHYHDSVAAAQNVTEIDNWFGLIDAPETPLSIVRAHKNWQARLAATALSIALGYETVVLSDLPMLVLFCKDKEMAWGRFQKVIIIG